MIIKVSGLKCYICDSYNKEPCPEEDLKLCGTHQAFDRCLIRMVKSGKFDTQLNIMLCERIKIDQLILIWSNR